jgi:hypothetical protein
MKKIFLTILFLFFVGSAFAGEYFVTCKWQHNEPEPEGYFVYHKTDGYNEWVPVHVTADNKVRIEGFSAGKHCFVVTAYVEDLEGPMCDPACIEISEPAEPGVGALAKVESLTVTFGKQE